MKYYLIAVVLFLQSINIIHAQPPRRDTVGWGVWRTGILRAPVVSGATSPITIMPITRSMLNTLRYRHLSSLLDVPT